MELRKEAVFLDKYLYSLLIFASAFVVVKIINKLFIKINKDKKIHIIFLRSAMQAIIIVFAVFVAGSQFSLFRELSGTLVASSTLVAAVIGFSLEEGITNLVHGLIISMSKPFNVGDRLNLPNQNITGIVESITLRHTVLRNVLTNTSVLVPNSIIDKEIIENNRYAAGDYNYYIDVPISRDSDVEKARNIISDITKKHILYIKDDTPYVWVNGFTDNAILLRVWIVTHTIDENFVACSEIRSQVAYELVKAGIKQPFVSVQDSCSNT